MSDAERSAVRGAAMMVIQRGVQAVGGLCFAALVPRTLGPELYGQYALVTSIAFWFAMASGLGLTDATTRYVPQLAARGETDRVRRLIGNLLTLRLASGGGAAGLYLLFTLVWWRDLDPVVLAIMAGSVWAQGLSSFVFTLFLGLDRAGLWGVGDAVRRWVLLVLVLPGYYLDGLRGAALAVLATEVCVLILGIWCIRLRFTWPDLRPDREFLGPYLRFGLAFYGAQLLSIAVQGSGEPLVGTFSRTYVEVGYFGLAHNIYLLAAGTLPQLMLAFAPMLSAYFDRGQAAALAEWSARLMRYVAIGGVLGVFGALFLADAFVPLLFGADYRPVAENLVPLSLAFLAVSIGSVPGLLALVRERPGAAVIAASVRLGLFWSLGPLLVIRWGSVGGCFAVLAAVVGHTGYLTWRMRDLIGGRLPGWAVPVGLGALFLPLAWFRSSPAVDAALYGIFVVSYGAGLLLLRVVTVKELGSVLSLLRRRDTTASDALPTV